MAFKAYCLIIVRVISFARGAHRVKPTFGKSLLDGTTVSEVRHGRNFALSVFWTRKAVSLARESSIERVCRE